MRMRLVSRDFYGADNAGLRWSKIVKKVVILKTKASTLKDGVQYAIHNRFTGFETRSRDPCLIGCRPASDGGPGQGTNGWKRCGVVTVRARQAVLISRFEVTFVSMWHPDKGYGAQVANEEAAPSVMAVPVDGARPCRKDETRPPKSTESRCSDRRWRFVTGVYCQR